MTQRRRLTISYGPSVVLLVVTTRLRNEPHLGHFIKKWEINGRRFLVAEIPWYDRAKKISEYDIREIDEELYLAVLDRAKAVREGDLAT